jgi:hypothetical protein
LRALLDAAGAVSWQGESGSCLDHRCGIATEQ